MPATMVERVFSRRAGARIEVGRVSSDEGRRAAAQDPSEPADPPVNAGAAGSAGAGDNWDPEGIAVAALGEVVAAFGAVALADENSLANRLSDLIPNDSLLREQRLLVAASRRNVAASIEEHMSQGIGIGAAVRLTAAALYEQEPFDSSGCEWVTSAFARALGYATEPIPLHRAGSEVLVASTDTQPASATPRIYPRAPTTAVPAPTGSRRKVVLAACVVVLAVSGITIGVLASSSDKGPSKKSSTSTSSRPAHTRSSSLPAGPPVWSSPQDVDPGSKTDGGIAGVSCSPTGGATGSCVAVDDDGNALSDVDGGWASSNDVDDGNGFDAVSCATPGFCVAVDDSGDALTYDNGTWGQPADIDGSNTLAGVACPTASFCVAVDDNGNALTYDSGNWAQPTDIDAGNDLDAVSCSSPASCTAVDDDGSAITYDGSNWGQPDDIDGGDTITSISCPSSSFCMAVDENGNAIGFDAGRWTQPRDIDGSINLVAVSCSTSQFCVAVDQDGDAVTARSAS
jgi:hypothetical protein